MNASVFKEIIGDMTAIIEIKIVTIPQSLGERNSVKIGNKRKGTAALITFAPTYVAELFKKFKILIFQFM